MNERKVARGLLVLARELIGLEFDTKKQMDDYKREHTVRRDTKMTVKPEGKKEPAKKTNKTRDKSREDLERALSEDISTHLRDSLTHTNRVVTEDQMYEEYNKAVNSRGHMGVTRNFFKKVWDEEVGEYGGLEKVEGGYKWAL
jgi:hypothetical protein